MLNKDKRDAMIDDLIYGRLAEMVINQVEVSQCSVQ